MWNRLPEITRENINVCWDRHHNTSTSTTLSLAWNVTNNEYIWKLIGLIQESNLFGQMLTVYGHLHVYYSWVGTGQGTGPIFVGFWARDIWYWLLQTDKMPPQHNFSVIQLLWDWQISQNWNHISPGCPKKTACSLHSGYNSTLEMARNKGRVCFEKFRKFSIW